MDNLLKYKKKTHQTCSNSKMKFWQFYSRVAPNFCQMCSTRSFFNWICFALSRSSALLWISDSDRAWTCTSNCGNTCVSKSKEELELELALIDGSKSIFSQFLEYVSRSSSTIMLCKIMQALIILPKTSMSHILAGWRIIENRAWRTPNVHSTSFLHDSCCLANNCALFPWGNLIDWTKIGH